MGVVRFARKRHTLLHVLYAQTIVIDRQQRFGRIASIRVIRDNFFSLYASVHNIFDGVDNNRIFQTFH